ncbi:hypothetical protein [Thermococcus sp. 9N3]|uniref:hypothetical protein n=1 Tax=Thermococcus sp. 9N3 TaxID=163002 RepID=UPI0014302C01|nr:hypothetical protein [Thermococcus sp. 9N3]NJE49779.1 hypothetical protein [Thermococcus sp. 9N3]
MLKLYHVIPEEVLKILARHNFRLVGPWREYYLLRGNALLIRELPLKVTFRGRERSVLKELQPYVSRVIGGKDRVSMKLKDGRHWLVLEFFEGKREL